VLIDAGARPADTAAPDVASDLTPAAQELASTPLIRMPIIRSGRGMAKTPLSRRTDFRRMIHHM
jgi:hypothetical protein